MNRQPLVYHLLAVLCAVVFGMWLANRINLAIDGAPESFACTCEAAGLNAELPEHAHNVTPRVSRAKQPRKLVPVVEDQPAFYSMLSEAQEPQLALCGCPKDVANIGQGTLIFFVPIPFGYADPGVSGQGGGALPNAAGLPDTGAPSRATRVIVGPLAGPVIGPAAGVAPGPGSAGPGAQAAPVAAQVPEPETFLPVLGILIFFTLRKFR